MAGVAQRISLAAPPRVDGHHEAFRCHHADILCNEAVFHRRWGWGPMQEWLHELREPRALFGATPVDGHIAWAPPPVDSEGERTAVRGRQATLDRMG